MKALKTSQILQLGGKKYRIAATLGEGTYGVVYKAINSKNEAVAIKCVKSAAEIMGCTSGNIPDEGTPATVLREVSLLKTIKHENVVK